jgi:hypothetical protein
MSALASASLDAARLSRRSRAGARAALPAAVAAHRPALGAAPPAGRPSSACVLRAAAGDSAGGSVDDDRGSLARAFASGAAGITGEELKELIFDKFSRYYDVRLQRRGDKMQLHVMWKHLQQRSFHLTEDEYDLQLAAVAEYLSMWQVADVVREGIAAAKFAPGMTIGGGARAFMIPLGVDVGAGAARSGEWNTF